MENVVLVKTFHREKKEDIESDIEELKGLIHTAGGHVVDVIRQKRDTLSPSFLIGKGKANEIAENYKNSADVVVFDHDLKPVQVRNLEELINKRVIDRTQLILDIFAQRARTKEGKLQVEFAQLNYILPRLTGIGIEMSRLGGGIGTRGPGETKLEVDRRKIRTRLQKIKAEIEKIRLTREHQRERRKSIPLPLVALVGYTNAGKTMMLNRLTKAGMLSEDRLFATLDPKIKKFTLPSGYKILFSDTVGFIKNLPPHLITAFRGTLEEVRDADIIVHLIDISNPEHEKQRKVVYDILKEIGAYEGKTIIEAFNKADLFSEDERKLVISRKKELYVSAKTGEGLERLVEAVSNAVETAFIDVEVMIPRDKQALLDIFYSEGVVVERKDKEEGVYLKARCVAKTYERFKKYLSEV